MNLLRAVNLVFLEQELTYIAMFPLCTSESLSLSVWTVAGSWTLCEMTLLSCTWWIYVTREGSRTFSPHLRKCEAMFFVFAHKSCSWNIQVMISVLPSWKKILIDSWQKLSAIFTMASISFSEPSTGFWYLSVLIVILKK